FHLPPGFRIELVAAEPDVRKPMNLNFDAAGRLWATQSTDYPYPVHGPGAKDVVAVFHDSNGDGVPDRPTVFGGGLTIPIGVLPLATPEAGALVFSIPKVWRLVDADGDGTSDRRDPFLGDFDFRDTHGMTNSFTWWIDGWVYATHGFANESTLTPAGGGSTLKMQSGNSYRFAPDGSALEQYTWGQVNPFGLTFDHLGHLFSADCHSKPAYQLLRGAYYPSFGKPDDGMGFGPTVIEHSHGSTGIAGIVFYEATQFPEAYRRTLFIGNPVTGRINTDRLEATGGTYRGIETADFLSCDDPWFRPVDLKLGPDGALYVADFYNCIIGHYEVPLDHPRRDRERGRLWRISYVGANAGPTAKPADLTKADVPTLMAALADSNLTVRVLATHQLVARGKVGVGAARAVVDDANAPPVQRAHALWVLARLGELDDDRTVALLADQSPLVRVHVLRMLAERPDWGFDVSPLEGKVREALADADGFVRRAAVEALGRHPRAGNVGPILDLLSRLPADDAQTVHAARLALRATVAVPNRLAALGAELPDDRQARVADVCLGLPTAESSRFLTDLLRRRLDEPRAAEFLRHAVRYADADDLPTVLRVVMLHRKRGVGEQRAALMATARALAERRSPAPNELKEWAGALAADLLGATDESAVGDGIELVRDLRAWLRRETTARRLAALAGPTTPWPNLRPAAWEAAALLDPDQAAPLLAQAVENPDESPERRRKAAELLAGLGRPTAVAEAARVLRYAPAPIAQVLAVGLAGTAAGAERLLTAVGEGKASPLLLQNVQVRARLAGAKAPDLEKRLAGLTADLPAEDETLRRLLDDRRAGFVKTKGDAGRGKAVFVKACGKCHQIGGEGGKVGPQLDGVGLRGLERLLEDTLAPNRNVDQAFRATLLALADGRLLSGLLLREEGNVVVLADAEGREVRVSKDEIAERRRTRLSPMPAGVAEQLPAAEFVDLMTYLLTEKTKVKADAAPAAESR
ncbi:MAG: PVC-type heme-binding CxxCH protein, partial [Planctomycetia bacterium]